MKINAPKKNALSQSLSSSTPATRAAAFGKLASRPKGDTFTQWVDRANAAKDKSNDGKLVGANGATFAAGTALSQIPGVTPDSGKSKGTVVFVNGMLTPLSQQVSDMKAIANAYGSTVLGVHNATEGLVADGVQSAADVAGIGQNAAVESLKATILQELRAGRELHLVAHSQGAIITQRALRAAKAELGEEKLKLLTVDTFGGAGGVYPDGPKYTHWINTKDMVPNMFGLGWDGSIRNAGAGRDAVIHRFEYSNDDQILQHLIDSAYLPQLPKK
jgi:hypothetical protein